MVSKETGDAKPLAAKTILVGATHGTDHFLNSSFQLIYPIIITELGLTVAHLGLIEASFEATSGFLQMIQGWLAKRVNKRTLLAFGSILESLATGLSSLATGFPHIVATRMMSGVGSSSMHPIGVSLMTENAGKHLRGRLIGTFSSLGNIGSVAAPVVVGLVLSVIGWRMTMLLFAVPSLVTGVALMVFLKSSRSGQVENPAGGGIREWGAILRNRSLMALTIATVLSRVYSIGAYFPAFFIIGLRLDVATATFLFLLYRLGRVPGPYLFGLLSDRLGRKPMIVASLLLSSIILYVLTLVGANVAALGVLAACIGLTSAAANVIIQAHIADSTTSSMRAPVFGIYFTLSEGLGAIWTLALGVLVASYGFGAAFTILAVTSFTGGLVTSRIRASTA